ncbi:MAG: hypothetical protein EA381_10590 [Planctomycetaceae bacterium]|nr:MAG: hypothetical protein EA381_10590 [Planctomycetaceae bacterium]
MVAERLSRIGTGNVGPNVDRFRCRKRSEFAVYGNFPRYLLGTPLFIIKVVGEIKTGQDSKHFGQTPLIPPQLIP